MCFFTHLFLLKLLALWWQQPHLSFWTKSDSYTHRFFMFAQQWIFFYKISKILTFAIYMLHFSQRNIFYPKLFHGFWKTALSYSLVMLFTSRSAVGPKANNFNNWGPYKKFKKISKEKKKNLKYSRLKLSLLVWYPTLRSRWILKTLFTITLTEFTCLFKGC